MSDVFLSAGIDLDLAEVAVQLRWVSNTQVWSGRSDGLAWLATRVDSADLWSPAWDDMSKTRAIVAGRFAFEESEWLEAERLPYKGGLAARLILDRWLKGGAHSIEQLNGGGLAIIIDEAARELHLWTDRLGFYPIYAWMGAGFVVCSHPDVAATNLAKAGLPCDFDAITMAEFLRTGTATQPHTYWRGIDQLDAGTRYRFTWGAQPRMLEKHLYWRPAYFDQPYIGDRREIVERLTNALTAAVRRRTLPRLGKVAVLLSAGADSRTALFAASEPSEVTCFTYYDEPNEELRGAQALASAAGAKHIAYHRSKYYYFENAEQAVRISGGMWSIESAHHTGLLSELKSAKFGTVLTGCYADYLLKGITYNRAHKQFFGRNLPLYKFQKFNYEWHHPHIKIGKIWDEKVNLRLESIYDYDLRNETNQLSKIEYARLMPIIREPDAGGRLFLRRCAPLDVFMSDNAVIDLFGQIKPEEKINGIPFGMAVSNITGILGSKVLNNNYSAPVGASECQRVVAFIQASLKRKLAGKSRAQPFERDAASIATVGSWPYFPRVIKFSQRLRDWHASQPADQREFLFEILGEERRNWSIEEWADRDSTLFMRYYTASIWLSQHPEALGRIAKDEDRV